MKSQKFRWGFALCLPLFLLSCAPTPEPSSSSEDSSQVSSGESVPSDDRGEVPGPGTTDMPNESFPDDPNNPYHKPDIYPSRISEETTPKDYNLYFYSAVEQTKRDAVWMWSKTYNSIGLIPTNKDVTLDGVDPQYKFSSLYMTYGKYYYDYNAWDFSSEGYFTLERDDALVGIMLRASTKSETETDFVKSIDIDLSKIAINPSGPTNIYIVEKAQNMVQVFTSTAGINDYLNNKTDTPIWTLEETAPSDFNIYTNVVWGNQYRDRLYVWGDAFAGIDIPLLDGAHPSKEIALAKKQDGTDVLFNALYFTYDKNYKAYDGWGSTTETVFTINETKAFSNLILKQNNGDQTQDVVFGNIADIPADQNGQKNLYVIETDQKVEGNKGKIEFFTSLADVQNYFKTK